MRVFLEEHPAVLMLSSIILGLRIVRQAKDPLLSDRTLLLN